MKVTEAVELYKVMLSSKQVAKAMHISHAKTIKLLITGGCYPTKKASKIKEMRDKGMMESEICTALHISNKALNKYTPYHRCVYNKKVGEGERK